MSKILLNTGSNNKDDASAPSTSNNSDDASQTCVTTNGNKDLAKQSIAHESADGASQTFVTTNGDKEKDLDKEWKTHPVRRRKYKSADETIKTLLKLLDSLPVVDDETDVQDSSSVWVKHE